MLTLMVLNLIKDFDCNTPKAGRNPLEHEALWQEMRLLHRHL